MSYVKNICLKGKAIVKDKPLLKDKIYSIVENKNYNDLTPEERLKINYLFDSLFGKELEKIVYNITDKNKNVDEDEIVDGKANERLDNLKDTINGYLNYKRFNIESEAYKSRLDKIFSKQYDAVVIFYASFGWNIELKQRPQHIAQQLAKKNILYLYMASSHHDKEAYSIHKEDENLYLIDMGNYPFKEALFNKLKEVNIPKFVHIYATCLYTIRYSMVKEYMDRGFKVLYDFVDEFSSDLSQTDVTDEVLKDHRDFVEDVDNVIVISTATKLHNDIVKIRGTEKNTILSPNGVTIEDFKKEKYEEPDAMKKIREKGNPVIGYYGALASWFDYEMVEYLAKSRPNYEIALIGWKYDNSYGKTNMDKYENIHYLGIVDYPHLANHSKYFDVATIPFLLNDVTKATSPVKLFEYMAVGNPIVTTDLEECRKYESCLIAKDKEDFVKKIDYCIDVLSNDEKYKKILAKEAEENTWSQRAQDIKAAMMKAVK